MKEGKGGREGGRVSGGILRILSNILSKRVEAKNTATAQTDLQAQTVKDNISVRLAIATDGGGGGKQSSAAATARRRKEYSTRMRRLAQLDRETGLLRSWLENGKYFLYVYKPLLNSMKYVAM